MDRKGKVDRQFGTLHDICRLKKVLDISEKRLSFGNTYQTYHSALMTRAEKPSERKQLEIYIATDVMKLQFSSAFLISKRAYE